MFHVFYLCQVLSTVQQSRDSWAASWHNSLFQNKTTILFGIHYGSSNTKISEFLWFNLRTDSCSYWRKSSILFTLRCFGWSLSIVSLCLHLSYYIASHSIQRPISSAWPNSCWPWLRRCLLEDTTSSIRNLHHATQAGRQSVGCEKISVTTSPLTSGRLTPQIVIPLIIIGLSWARCQQNSVTHNKNNPKARIAAESKYLNLKCI